MDMDAAELEDLESEEVSVYLCMQCKKRFTRDLIEGEEEKPAPRDLRIVYH
jgi:DNA-directed RNA polymerase subunit RPC12/RpoP